MNPAEVVVAEVERDHGLEVHQLLREAIGQSREATSEKTMKDRPKVLRAFLEASY